MLNAAGHMFWIATAQLADLNGLDRRHTSGYRQRQAAWLLSSGGGVLWKVTEKVPEVPSPIYYKDCVYMIKNGGIITCVDAKSGRILYRERLGVSGPYFASPIVANDNIYIPSSKGIVTVIKAGNQLEVLARNDLKERIFATPAAISNTLYVRTAENLYAFGE